MLFSFRPNRIKIKYICSILSMYVLDYEHVNYIINVSKYITIIIILCSYEHYTSYTITRMQMYAIEKVFC